MKYSDEDNEFMDAYMMGVFSDRSKKSPQKKGGGCASSFAIILMIPVLTIIGVAMLMS